MLTKYNRPNALRSCIITFAVYREARKNLSNLQKPFLGKNKKTTGNLGRDQDKRASSRTELNVQNYTFFGANTEDRVTSSGYQLLYILLTSLDRPLGNTTMNRNECTFLLTAFRRKVLNTRGRSH